MDIMNIMQKVCEKHQWEYANEYGERGYGSVDTKVIIMVGPNGPDLWGNKYPRIEAAMKEAGIELESYDEWYVDSENGGKAWRTTGDSYLWQCALGYGDGFVLTPDDDPEAWIEWALDGNVLNRERLSEDALIEAGFQPWPDEDNEYQTGLHEGMNDDPSKAREAVLASLADVAEDAIDIIIYVHESSQFYGSWKVFVRVNWTTEAISSSGSSHDMQMADALQYLENEHPEAYEKIAGPNSEVKNLIFDGAWLDTERMGVDVEWSSWITDEIEDTGHVFWEDGEPYARIKPERITKGG